jgi:hypothetical protein
MSGDVRVWVDGEHLCLLGEAGLLEVEGAPATLEKVVGALQSGASIPDLLAICEAGVLLHLLEQLFTLHWLHFVADNDASVTERYRQVYAWLANLTLRPGEALKRMSGQTVAILGVGGLGIQVLEHLVGLGLRSAILLDADVVEASNLNRQYGYTPRDIGRPKAQVAAEFMLRQVPHAQVRAIVQYVATPADLAILDDHEIGIFVNCADQPADIETIVSHYAHARKLATMTGGVGVQRGYWGPLAAQGAASIPARASTVRVGSRLVPKIRCTSSHGPYNSIIAALMAHDVFAYLSGSAQPRSLAQRMGFDFSTMQAGAIAPAEEAT